MTTMKTAKRDRRETPAYTYADASRFVRLPVATLRSWVTGRGYLRQDGPAHFRPLIVPADAHHLSFLNLIEAHVLKAIRRRYGVPMRTVRPALDYVGRELGVDHPLAHAEFETDGVSLFVRRLGKLLNASQSGQVAMPDVLKLYLQRIEYDKEGLALRFFPYTRTTEQLDQPQQIVINPAVMWGRPVIEGTRVDTAIVFQRYEAGESAQGIAEDLDLTIPQVEEAIRCEAGWAKRAA